MKKVLLPIDGTRRSLQTITWLKENYKPEEVNITMFMVTDPVGEMEIKAKYTSAQEYMMSVMKRSSKSELIDPGYKVDYETAYGNPGEEIVKFAKKGKFDAIIMTKSTKEGWLSTIGSVTTYCVKYADTVVMIIPEKQQ